MDYIKQLKQLDIQATRERYPNLPEYAVVPKKYHERNANGLTQMVIDWLRFHGWQAERINTTGRRIDNRKTSIDVIGRARTIGRVEWIPTTGQKGSADISATVMGRSIKLEIKYGKDRQSEDQKKYQQDIEKSGGVYLIVRKFDEFVKWYNQFTGTQDAI